LDLTFKLYVSESAFSTWFHIHQPDNSGLLPLTQVYNGQLNERLYYTSLLGLTLIAKLPLATDAANRKTTIGLLALRGAAWSGEADVAFLLLDNNADMEAKENFDKAAPAVATARGYETLIRLLVDRGADFQSRDNRQRSPLQLAALEGHTLVVEFLAGSAKNSVDRKDDLDLTALYYAAG
jgi:ankyrin repeat protein